MRRRDAAVALAAASVLPTAWAQGGPVEGKQYSRLPQALPATPGKVEVIEFFFYRCPHCYALDPELEAWVHQLPADVSFRRVPVGQVAMLKLHQRMFYALEAMGALSPKVHAGIFSAFHVRNVDASDEAGVVALVTSLGVDPARFKQTFNSFGVQTKVSQGNKLAETCGIENVPALVVGGRWRTGPSMAGLPSQNEVDQGKQSLAVADFLIKMARTKA